MIASPVFALKMRFFFDRVHYVNCHGVRFAKMYGLHMFTIVPDS